MSDHPRKGQWPRASLLPPLGERECSKCLTMQDAGVGAEDRNGNFRCFNCLKLSQIRRQPRDPVKGHFARKG